MDISISNSARSYLLKKQSFYQYRNRMPRLVMVAKTCRGAEFRIVFEAPAESDLLHRDGELGLYIPQDLIRDFGGFNVDTELFFFALRLLIQPKVQVYKCDCKHKCNNEER
jgi:hypothetical protein